MQSLLGLRLSFFLFFKRQFHWIKKTNFRIFFVGFIGAEECRTQISRVRRIHGSSEFVSVCVRVSQLLIAYMRVHLRHSFSPKDESKIVLETERYEKILCFDIECECGITSTSTSTRAEHSLTNNFFFFLLF